MSSELIGWVLVVAFALLAAWSYLVFKRLNAHETDMLELKELLSRSPVMFEYDEPILLTLAPPENK